MMVSARFCGDVTFDSEKVAMLLDHGVHLGSNVLAPGVENIEKLCACLPLVSAGNMYQMRVSW